MVSRRNFLKKGAITAMALSMTGAPGCIYFDTISSQLPIKSKEVRRVLVAWYSQTGNTERTGKLLAKTIEAKGIKVTCSDLRAVDKKIIAAYHLILIGSPVFYYDTPEYVKKWLKCLPEITGIPVASYVTFGGPEGNHHNAACSILQGMVDKGGVPVAISSFMNMGTYPLSWSGETIKEHTWNSRNLPNEETYKAIRKYAIYVIEQVKKGQRAKFSKRLTLREFSTFFGPTWWTKQFLENHHIIEEKCIDCGTCVDKCPVNAIDPSKHSVDTEACVACFGCINNCPAQAVYMEYRGRRVIGYLEFMKQHNLKVLEPPELRT